MQTRWRWLALGLLAVALFAYIRPLLMDETFVLRDHLSYTIPSRAHLGASLAAGNLPEWWDGVGLGIPYAANPGHGVTYPPTWISGALPIGFATDFLLVLHIVLAGFGVAMLARRWGADSLGAWFAGASFMCSGYVASMVSNGIPVLTMAWTPWVVWAADRLASQYQRADRIRAAAVFSAFYAAQILSGDPAGYLGAGVLAAVVVMTRAPRRWFSLAVLTAAAFSALVMAAVAILPALELLGASERAGGIASDSATVWSLHPVRMLQWVWPHVLGTSGSIDADLAGVMADASGTANLAPSWSLSVFVGAPVLLFVGIAAFTESYARWLAAASIGFAILALGAYTPLYGIFRAIFIPERLLRYPEKHIAEALILWCTLGGVGFTLAFKQPTRHLRRLAAGVAGLLSLLVLMVVLFRGAITRALQRAADGAPLDADAAISTAISSGAIAALVAASVAGALWLRGHERLGKLVAPFAAVVVVAHALTHSWSLQPLASRSDLGRPQILAEVERDRGTPRTRLYRQRSLAPRGGKDRISMALLGHHTGIENAATRYGFAYVPGYDPALSRRLHQVWDRASEGFGSRMLDMFDIELAVLPGAAERIPGMEGVSRTGTGLTLVRNPDRRPRAFVADRWLWVADDEAAMASMFAPAFELAEVRLIADGTGARPEPVAATATMRPCALESPRPELVRLRCRADRPSMAVLLDAWAKGWTATVDGEPAVIHRADALVRAVAIGPGEHTVEFRYATPGLRKGALISLISWLLCIGLILLTWWRSRE